tara:strand:+ start:1338 stop:1652 length:315 start_codon:yes stop_codon:yes gene_type:complete
MGKTKDSVQIVGNDLESVVRAINFAFQRITDRMDKIEGIRGGSSIESDLDMNTNKITDVGSGSSDADVARRDELLGAAPTFAGLNVNGDIFVKDANGNIIHSME